MRYGVLGDIHGNREALGVALAELERHGIDRILCLGDIVGYNADPDECAEELRRRKAIAIAGNHDLIGTGRLDFARCSNKAMHSLKRTRRLIGNDTAAWLRQLPANKVIEDHVVLVHGGVRDVEQYMVTPALIAQNAAFLRTDFPDARLCFFGHSHEQKVYAVQEKSVVEVSPVGRVQLEKSRVYFVNPGSVDAQRKSRHKLAEFAILDTVGWSVEFLRLPYDAAVTEAKAAAFGYRLTPVMDRYYSLRRKLAARTAQGGRRVRPLQ
jgi:predicted phosphodiesterase